MLRHTALPRGVGAGVPERLSRLKLEALGFVADVLTTFVHPQVLDTETARDHHRLYERLKRSETVAVELQQVNLRPFRVLVGDLANELVSPERLRRYGFHQIDEDQLEGVVDLVIGRLGVGQLVAFPHGVQVTVCHNAFEACPIVVQIFYDVQALAVEVSQSPMPQSGFSRCLHCQLRSAVLVDEMQRERVWVAPTLLKWKG